MVLADIEFEACAALWQYETQRFTMVNFSAVILLIGLHCVFLVRAVAVISAYFS